ncbi:hypothetical protein [Candidatus Berkiella aquae]|uniref:Uncharacterized protein n=1 Tax=Candidatus Berkiella aquae TaxID=295108 RepID=A0A0Q9YN21_9GAMM|nr:hypothetical protein [Candidatus Berkiella aquae]MCS5712625.1 hypothetical protein [Candidatus Berkiella aquae]
MEWINPLIGILIGALLIIPAFFTTKKWLKISLALVAIVAALGTAELSKRYFYPHVLGWQFEHEIVKHPLFKLIAKHHPNEFALFVKQVKQGLVDKQPQAILSGYSSQLLGKVFYEHLQTAPNEAVMRYLGAVLELYRYLYNQDPQAVLAMEYGQATTGNFGAIWSDNNFQTLLNHLLQVKTKVIEASIDSPVAPPSQTQAALLLQGILKEMSEKYGEDLVKQMFARGQSAIPANIIAPLIIDFYARIGMQGPENAGVMMRYIASLKVKGTAEEQTKDSQKDK